jgi:hypothetical protein
MNRIEATAIRWRRKIIIGFALAMSGKNAAATVTAVAAAGITSFQIGLDPIPWAIGAMASTVVYAYRTPSTRSKALANGLVCIFIGGVCAPWTSQLVRFYYDAVWANDYVLAGIMSAAWPWAAPVAWNRAVAMFDGLVKGVRND